MAGLREHGEWQWYLRDHKWWWKWPLIGATVGIWLGAMVMFVPWQSSVTIDDVETRPATTEHGDDTEPVESIDPTITNPPIDTTEVGADVEIPATTIDAVAEADVVQSLTPEPPTSVEGEAEETETTEASGRRPARTDRKVEPAPAPILNPTPSPFGEDIFTPAPPTPSTTVKPPTPTTSPTTVRPPTPTTTVRPPTTTEPPPPPPPPPPTTDNRTTTADNRTTTADNRTTTADNRTTTADNRTTTADNRATRAAGTRASPAATA
jgi:hypothetical protein